MNQKYESMRQLAQAMFDSVAGEKSVPQKGGGASAHVWKRMQLALTRFAGADGFTALFRRALSLASIDGPPLEGVKIGPDGLISGIDSISDAQSVALATCLLEMLVTLIGERLTLHLVSDAWPEL